MAMIREQHRVIWDGPHELSEEELAEYAGYVRTEDGVASPDNFTEQEITDIASENLIITDVTVDPLTPFLVLLERSLAAGTPKELPRAVRRRE